jgi:uncharacterized membrane protein HdeD (DUF308 family)
MSFLSLTTFNNIDVGLVGTLTMIALGTAFTVLVSLIALILIIRKCVELLVKDQTHQQDPTTDKALAAAIGLSLVLNDENRQNEAD